MVIAQFHQIGRDHHLPDLPRRSRVYDELKRAMADFPEDFGSKNFYLNE